VDNLGLLTDKLPPKNAPPPPPGAGGN
jgi:hypothetical protein